MKKALVLLTVSLFIVAGCQSQGTGQKQSIGTLLGAVAGGVAGAQVGKGKGQLVGVAAGTLLGAFLGSEIGQSLDRADLVYANQTAQRALERNAPNESATWYNPDSGHRGAVTPTTQTYQVASGQYCRQYEQQVVIEGKTETAYGTACRNQFGEWVIQ